MKISKSHLLDGKTISITGSKSISNRLLILGKLFGDLKIENLSNSQDTQLLQKALNEDSETVDIHHAGTAMRFLTSFYAIQEDRKSKIIRRKNRCYYRLEKYFEQVTYFGQIIWRFKNRKSL